MDPSNIESFPTLSFDPRLLQNRKGTTATNRQTSIGKRTVYFNCYHDSRMKIIWTDDSRTNMPHFTDLTRSSRL